MTREMSVKELSPQEKWRAGSNLQKAIRRGRVDVAESAARSLWRLDPAWVLHRMSVIAVEDVGLGDVASAMSFLRLPGGKKAFTAAGGEDLLVEMTKRMSSTVKDRSACDMGSLSKLHVQSFAMTFSGFPEDGGKLRDIILNDESSLRDKVLAGWLLAGTKRFPCEGLPPDLPGDWDAFMKAWSDAGVASEFLDLAEAGMKKMREFHPVAIPVCGMSLSESEEVGESSSDLPKENLLLDGATLPSALDWHVSEGKSAIVRTLSSSKELRSVFSGQDSELKYAKCLFRTEGGAVDRRLSYGLSDFLWGATRESLSNWVGRSWEDIEAVVVSSKDLLLAKRNGAISLSSKGRPSFG